MTYESHARNPFMLMLNPEVVFAAMEASERLKALNSHQCRPLDKVVPAANDDSGSDGDGDGGAPGDGHREGADGAAVVRTN